jgi:hypothetical protein
VYRSAVMAQSVLVPGSPSGEIAVLAKESHEVERAIASLSIGCILIHSHNFRSSGEGEGKKTTTIMNTKYPGWTGGGRYRLDRGFDGGTEGSRIVRSMELGLPV